MTQLIHPVRSDMRLRCGLTVRTSMVQINAARATAGALGQGGEVRRVVRGGAAAPATPRPRPRVRVP